MKKNADVELFLNHFFKSLNSLSLNTNTVWAGKSSDYKFAIRIIPT